MVAPAMETATNRTGALALAALALAVSGCGAGSSVATHVSSTKRASSAFAWLRPGAPPAGWPRATIPDGATMAYPPGWQRTSGDPGTATVSLFDRHHGFLGYLNITPRQSDETLTNWGHFRVEHNAEEHERRVTTLAVGSGLRFRTGQGACVKDAYTTITGARYTELACLVMGRTSSTVIVGASPPAAWTRISPVLEQAISSMIT